jgi:ubiquinone/menaquinone biosynthesis C-methylase UbiE
MVIESWDKVAEQVNFNLEIDWDRLPDFINTKARVLDFGCGYGRVCKQLNQCGYLNVVGADPSSAMIARGHRIYPELSLLHSSETRLPFDDDSFDAIVACAVFTSIPSSKEREDAAEEIARVFKPGGILHISEFSASEEREFMSALGAPMRYSTPKALRDLFEGFECIHEEVVGANTMSGKRESSYRAFLRKPVHKGIQTTSA